MFLILGPNGGRIDSQQPRCGVSDRLKPAGKLGRKLNFPLCSENSLKTDLGPETGKYESYHRLEFLDGIQPHLSPRQFCHWIGKLSNYPKQ